jgi:hypothetical protein
VTKGVLTVGNGGIGDIPVSNMVTAAATITQANILSEIQKIVDAIVNSEVLQEYVEENATYYMPFKHYAMMINAVSALPIRQVTKWYLRMVTVGSWYYYQIPQSNIVRCSMVPTNTFDSNR